MLGIRAWTPRTRRQGSLGGPGSDGAIGVRRGGLRNRATLPMNAALIHLPPDPGAQIDRAIVSSLFLTQSLLLVWRQLAGLAAATVVIFAAAYIGSSPIQPAVRSERAASSS